MGDKSIDRQILLDKINELEIENDKLKERILSLKEEKNINNSNYFDVS